MPRIEVGAPLVGALPANWYILQQGRPHGAFLLALSEYPVFYKNVSNSLFALISCFFVTAYRVPDLYATRPAYV